MKKILFITICVLLAAGDSFGRGALANENKSGLYARSIEAVLRLDEKEIDLGTAALIISEQWSDVVPGRRYMSRLDDMAYEIRDRLEAKKLKANHKAIAVINEYLFGEKGFKSIKEADDPNDLFLHSVLDRKQGYCLSLSILYLAIGERLGLPVYGVVVPGHFFVRYDDGRVRFNIETTSKGGYGDDEHYMREFKVPRGSESIYMTNLNKLQTLGCFFNNLGNSYTEVGNTEQALAALEKAAEINPLLVEARTNLGNVYMKKERTEDAIREYEAALKINPGEAKAHNNLGNAYIKQERITDAIYEYKQAIEYDPNFIDAYKNLAIAYCKQNTFDAARMRLREAIALWPKDGGLYRQLGDVYSQMADYKEAMSQYKKALKIEPGLAEAYCGIAFCYNRLGHVEDEIDAYKKALAMKPNMAAALAKLGDAYFGKKEYAAAIGQYKKAILANPNDGIIYYNLGAAYSNKGDYEEAAAAYLRAVEINPKMGDAHNGLAFAFYRLKNYDSALKHIKIAEESGIKISEELLAAIKANLR